METVAMALESAKKVPVFDGNPDEVEVHAFINKVETWITAEKILDAEAAQKILNAATG